MPLADQRFILLFLADIHSNHRLGLLSPYAECHYEDEQGYIVPYHPRLTPAQERLWEWWVYDLERVRLLAGSDPLICWIVGDLCQGNAKKAEIVSTRTSDQIFIAEANLDPVMRLPTLQGVSVMIGTNFHNMGEGSAEQIVSRILGNKYPNIPVDSPHHILAEVGNLVVDLAHHGGHPGTRKWLEGNVFEYYIKDIMMRHLLDGQRPPDLLIRAHFHRLVSRAVDVRARGKKWRTEGYIMPSYCFIDEYARKAARSPYKLTIGMLAAEVQDGKLQEVHEFKRELDFRTRKVYR